MDWRLGGHPTINFNFLSGVLDPSITFSRASSATEYNASGILTTVGNNIARFDYNPSVLKPNGLLIEQAATNFILQSADLSNAAWTSNNVTSITGNSGIAPDGTLTAAQIVSSGASGGRFANQSTGSSSGTTYTTSAFFKYISGPTTLQLTVANQAVFGGAGGDRFVQFNGSTGAFVSKSTEVSSFAIQALPNGWFKVSGTFTPTASAGNAIACYAAQGATTYQAWGAQVVVFSGPSSYIATLSAGVLRAIDSAKATNIPWFNPAAGTLLVQAMIEEINTVNAVTIASFNDGTTSNQIKFIITTSGIPEAQITVAGVTKTSGGSLSAVTANTPFTLAISYKSGANLFSANGNADTAGTFGASALPTGITQLTIGDDGVSAQTIDGWEQGIAYWNFNRSQTQINANTATLFF